MGSNVVRIVRSDHRRIAALLNRAAGPHRNGEQLREEIVTTIRAHAEATSQELLPYVVQRLDSSRERVDQHLRLLDSLQQAAADLDSAVEDRAALARLSEVMEEHVESEDQEFLGPLDDEVDVMRLRRLGEMFQRRRDTELKSSRRTMSRMRRPDPSRAELYERARRQRIEGRSKMTKWQLSDALGEERDR